MDISGLSLLSSASQPLKLPIPRLSSLPASTSNWTPNEIQQIDDTTQQKTTKKPQNKRGRKPLTLMPTAKKHIQNLTNQRAFRQRRENYIRNLENKASRFEILLKDAQIEVKTLKERVELLEKQIDIEEGKNNCKTISNEKISNEDNGNQSSRCFTPFTTNTSPIAPSFSFNDQHRLISQPPISCSSLPVLPSSGTVENVIRDQIFCETKEDDLIMCEPSETTMTGIDKCLTEDKQKRMMILPKEILSYPTATTIITSPLYSNYSHWELSHHDDYFSPVVISSNPLTHHF